LSPTIARLLPFDGIFFSFGQEMEFDCLNYCVQSLPVFHGSAVSWGRKEMFLKVTSRLKALCKELGNIFPTLC